MPRRAQRQATLATKNATGSAIAKHTTVTVSATNAVRSTTHTVSHSVKAWRRLSSVKPLAGFWV